MNAILACGGTDGTSVSVDIWSVGCIMAEMITGKILFKGNDRILLRRASWDFGQGVGAGWATLCSLQCVPDLGTDLDQLKEIMKVTGTPPPEFVQKLQSAEVSGELGGGLHLGVGAADHPSSPTGQRLHGRSP